MITRSLFYEKWWLDCVCEDGEWGIVDIVEKNTTIAEMPWYIKKKYGFDNVCVLETDSPYLPPEPLERKAKNTSANIPLIKEFLEKNGVN
jgi:hypothetical protein